MVTSDHLRDQLASRQRARVAFVVRSARYCELQLVEEACEWQLALAACFREWTLPLAAIVDAVVSEHRRTLGVIENDGCDGGLRIDHDRPGSMARATGVSSADNFRCGI